MLAARFLRVAVIYVLIGMALGIYMAASANHNQAPTHAHINLLGYVSMFLYGLFYHAYPNAAVGNLAKIHFWLSNISVIGMVSGVAIIYSGDMKTGEPIASLFSVLAILSMALFVKIVFTGTRSD